MRSAIGGANGLVWLLNRVYTFRQVVEAIAAIGLGANLSHLAAIFPQLDYLVFDALVVTTRDTAVVVIQEHRTTDAAVIGQLGKVVAGGLGIGRQLDDADLTAGRSGVTPRARRSAIGHGTTGGLAVGGAIRLVWLLDFIVTRFQTVETVVAVGISACLSNLGAVFPQLD